MKMTQKLLVLFLFIVLLTSCNSPTAAPGESENQVPKITPTLIVPESTKGGIRVTVSNLDDMWNIPSIPTTMWAAPFVPDETGEEGIFVLEPSIHRSTTVEGGGVFQINNIDPGKYVLIIGPVPEEAVTVQKDNKPQVIEVLAGKLTDLGTVTLSR